MTVFKIAEFYFRKQDCRRGEKKSGFNWRRRKNRRVSCNLVAEAGLGVSWKISRHMWREKMVNKTKVVGREVDNAGGLIDGGQLI